MGIVKDGKKIYILASKGLSFTSKVIRWYQFGFSYTHIGYVWSLDDKRNPVVVEAWLPRVRLGRFSEAHTPKTPFSIFSIIVEERQKRMIESFLLKQIGKKYDLFGLLSFAIRRKFPAKNDRWFCSELVFTAFQKAGINLLNYTSPQEVTPALFLKSPLLRKEFDSILP